MFPLNSDAKMTQIGEQKFIRVQEIVSSPQNFQEGGPTDPKLNVSPPHHAPSVSVITPLTLHSGGAEIRTGPEQTNRQQSLHHSIIYFSYLKPFFFLCAPNFPSCRLSAYFPLPRRRQSLSNPHNTTLQLSNLAQRSPCPCGFRQSNTRVRASVRARARTESVCER